MIPLFFYSFGVAFSGAAMPGPLLVLTIDQVTKKGFWMSPVIIIGHSILEIAIVIGLVFGLGMFLGNNIVQGIIGIAGGSFLIWMGIGMLRNVPKITLKLEIGSQNQRSMVENPVIGGVLLSLSNPYWTIWWITIGMAMLTKANALGRTGVAVFYFGHILGDFVWYGFIALMLTLGKRLINDTSYRVLIAICGEFVSFLGGMFVASGIISLFF